MNPSCISRAPKSKHIMQSLPNNGLKLNKGLLEHIIQIQGIFTESSSTFEDKCRTTAFVGLAC